MHGIRPDADERQLGELIGQWAGADDAAGDFVYCDDAGDGGIDVAYLDGGDEKNVRRFLGGRGKVKQDTLRLAPGNLAFTIMELR
jgi:hypothetical protein